ncbi:MAG: HAD family hydrolase [Bacteroidales bacterium]|nr:HAD family hydrolase [Bacteroidales bacterium]
MKVGNKPLPHSVRVKGVIFDYGGTIDTNSRHWAAVLWEKYREAAVPCQYEQFREAYIFAERALAKYPYIRPDHNFLDVLQIKVKLELEYLAEHGFVNADERELCRLSDEVAQKCYEYVRSTLQVTRPVLERLSHQYKMVLVSNFYGNIHTILRDFALDGFFSNVIESSVVGVRKPDPAIYQLGVNALGLPADEVLVVGDSFSKDIVPAKTIGCHAVWLRGEGWGHEETDETLPDMIISNLEELTLNRMTDYAR